MESQVPRPTHVSSPNMETKYLFCEPHEYIEIGLIIIEDKSRFFSA
jgi:hypothetical protein